MHTVAVYYESQSNNVTYDPLAVVTDQCLTPAQSQGYQFPKNYKALAACVMGVNLSAARINAPSLRNLVLPEIYPGIAAATVPTRPSIIDYRGQGPQMLANESVVVETSRAGADAQPVSAALWVTDRFTPAPGGPIYTAVASFTNTLVAGAWTLCTLTFNQTLPAGLYAVVGLNVTCGDSFVSRLVFPGQNQWRPGCVNNLAYGNLIQPNIFTMGYMGKLGEFYNTAQPQLEVFGLVAGAETGAAYLDLIKIA